MLSSSIVHILDRAAEIDQITPFVSVKDSFKIKGLEQIDDGITFAFIVLYVGEANG